DNVGTGSPLDRFVITSAAAVNLSGDVSTAASSTGSGIADPVPVNLQGATRTFSVADGSASSDFTINGIISNGGLTKAGAGTLTAVSGTVGVTTLTFASASRTAGATVLFRGDNLGSNPGATNTNIKFTAAAGLNLKGGGGAAGSTNINIVPYAVGDSLSTG